MTRIGFFALCGVTAVALSFAVFSVMRQPSVRAPDVAGAAVLPKLAERLNGLKSVVIHSKDGTLTFDWDGKGWVSRDRDNYPADAGKLASLVVQMTRLTKVEAKTRIPAKYHALNLDDPKTPDSQAKEVVLLDAGGSELADLIVGKRKFSLGSKENGVYVRVPNTPQTWLALGDVNPGTKPSDWLMRDIVHISDAEIKRVTVTQPDGSRVVVERSAPTDDIFKVTNLPKGQQLASEAAGNDIGHLLSNLLLEDVAKADSIVFLKDKTTAAIFDGFDGIHVSVEMTESAGNTWLRVGATADAAAAPNEKDGGKDWNKIADDISTRGDKWVFEVPSYEVAPLKKRMSDLIKKPEKGTKS